MSENNETHAQIVAEVRDNSKSAKLGMKLGIYGHLPTIYGKPLDVYFAELADRLEAATQREREATGNSAALRMALGELRAELWNNTVISGKRKSKLYEIADAALAKPARNCDVYDKEEVRMAYHLHGDGLMTMQAVVDWLYSAKKRGDESPRTEQEGEVRG